MKKVIPNFITILNLFIGVVAIVQAFENQIHIAAYLVFVAGILDYLDGFFARILNAQSEMGKMLDSLADMVSFGILPAVIFYQMMVMSLTINDATFNLETADFFEKTIMYSSFLIAVFAALRLARFNVDSDQKYSFKGLPVPAMTLFVSGYFLSIYNTGNQALRILFLRSDILLILIIFLSLLMVSRINMFSLKFQNFGIKDNKLRYLFLLLSLITLIFFYYYAIPFIIIGYILTSFVLHLTNPSRR